MSSERSVHGPAGRDGVTPLAFLSLVLLLVLPLLAAGRLHAYFDWRLFAGMGVAVSLFTFFAYWIDKRMAEAGRRRIPELTLHVAEFAGGWPGAFLAQRKFRHKICKASYQCGFWTIVMIHQAIAADCLNGWRAARTIFRLV